MGLSGNCIAALEAFYYINQKPNLSSQTSWVNMKKIKIEIYLFTVFVLKIKR